MLWFKINRNMIKNFISRWTMVRTTREGFWDSIARQKIYYWQDCYFDTYMAASKWGFRIKID
jgi:hypothetical protein